ncbi:RHS repeat-associated core domain-containing protein [Pseudomonas abietaniphila]|uniref:RHS repeat-associated core domain-containing protein n=1 Tax=Pseudomonas abietaniphila TaxID=89065 RepID=A0A1G7Z2G5_9PSED|nr:RHS repeat-associated core domain-containing protein [Pseudomonas abietaniphila]SDH02755.1 RHS repeat-associated core domain-containing protein [Pseudomonas abietaniphila]
MCTPSFRSLLLATDLHNTVLAGFGPSESGHMAYTAYGAHPSHAAPVSHSGFNGQLRERGTGWYHLGNGHRIYNPALMRFQRPDVLSPFDKGGLNPYAYCLGDPVNYADPTGQTPDWLQPVLTIGLHAFTIAATVIAAAVAGPPVGAALVAARMTLTGSSLAIAASTLTLAGVKQARYVAHVGTAISALGALTRVGLGVQSLVARKELRRAAVDRVAQLFGRTPAMRKIPGALPVRQVTSSSEGALSDDLNRVRGSIASITRTQPASPRLPGMQRLRTHYFDGLDEGEQIKVEVFMPRNYSQSL